MTEFEVRRNQGIKRVAKRAARARLEGRIQQAINDERNLDTIINGIVHPVEREDANAARDEGTTEAMNES